MALIELSQCLNVSSNSKQAKVGTETREHLLGVKFFRKQTLIIILNEFVGQSKQKAAKSSVKYYVQVLVCAIAAVGRGLLFRQQVRTGSQRDRALVKTFYSGIQFENLP